MKTDTSPASFAEPPIGLGLAAVSCAFLGLLAFVGYGRSAAQGIAAVHVRDSVAAQRMVLYASSFSLAQLLLGLLAIGLGWVAAARQCGRAVLVKSLGASAMWLGVIVLMLLLVVV